MASDSNHGLLNPRTRRRLLLGLGVAALGMLEALETPNARWEAVDGPARIRIGIGIATGEAIVGNIGSLTGNLDYTAIGDTVNLAARLEGLNKEYGSSVIISEATRQELSDDAYELKPIDEVKVKRKDVAVQIHELVGWREAGPGTTSPDSSGSTRQSRAAAVGPDGPERGPGSDGAGRGRASDERDAEVVASAGARGVGGSLLFTAQLETAGIDPGQGQSVRDRFRRHAGGSS